MSKVVLAALAVGLLLAGGAAGADDKDPRKLIDSPGRDGRRGLSRPGRTFLE
jgi:hypothetical protein